MATDGESLFVTRRYYTQPCDPSDLYSASALCKIFNNREFKINYL